MGWFGGSTSKSYSTTIMQDQRVTAEEAEVVVGAGADVSLPGSLQIGEQAVVGDVLIQEYTPAVQATVTQAIETFAETSQEVTEVLGEKLIETQQGVASILPKMAVWGVVGLVVYFVAQLILFPYHLLLKFLVAM